MPSDVRAPRPRRAGPVRRSGFPRLAAAHAASAAADAAVAVALASTLFFAVPLGEARGQVALYLLVTMAPFAVLGPLVGPLLDRHPGSYRYGVFAAALARTVLCLLLAGRTGGLELFPLAFGLLVASRVHAVSRTGLVPEVLPAGRPLIWANGRLTLVASATGALTAALAVGLARLAGPDAVLHLGAAAGVVGTVAALDLPRGRPDGARTGGGPPDGARPPFALRRDRSRARLLDELPARVVAAGVVMATLRLAVGFLTFFLAFLVRERGAGGRELGVLVAVAAAGTLAGAVLGPVARRVLAELPLLLVLLGLVAATAAWAAAGGGLVRGGVAAAAVGLATGAGRLAFDSLLQADAPAGLRGRALTRYETVFQVSWVAGAAAALVPLGGPLGYAALTAACAGGAAASVRALRRTGPGPVRRPGGTGLDSPKG